jgi:hypothetical protein
LYAAVPVAPGQPWIHSGLSGLNQGWVQPGSELAIFDPALCAQESVSVWLYARAGENLANLTIQCGAFSQTFQLTGEMRWIECAVPVPEKARSLRLNLTADANAYVETYRVR